VQSGRQASRQAGKKAGEGRVGFDEVVCPQLYLFFCGTHRNLTMHGVKVHAAIVTKS
jgi:hypothetical protein